MMRRERMPRAAPVIVGVVTLVLLVAMVWPRPPLLALARVAVGLGRNDVTAADLDPRTARNAIVLVAGIDDRSVLEGDVFGAFEGRHADVLLIVSITASSDPSLIVSVPRDLRARVPGYGEQRLGAYRHYGATTLVRAVRSIVHVPINHYVEIDLAGFAAIMDAVGGVAVRFPYDARDRVSGFVARRGTRWLDGQQALAYIRARQYEERRDGRWRRVADDDIGRIRRQHRVMSALLADPVDVAGRRVLDALIAAGGHLTVDRTMDLQDVVGLTRSVSAATTDLTTMPTRRAVPRDELLSPFPPLRWGGGAVREPVPLAAERLVARLRAHHQRGTEAARS